MKTLTIIWIGMLLCAVAGAEERAGASAELQRAKEALNVGRYTEARKCLARIQAFYYRDAELMPEALYYEAWIDDRLGGTKAKVSALEELCALYSSSPWSMKARSEFRVTD